MTESNLLELAKGGDPRAIATLMNRSLQPKGISVEARLKDECLEVWLKSNRVLHQQVLSEFVRKGMMSIAIESIKTVRVYAQQTSDGFPDWIEEFKLGEIQSLNLDVKKPEKSAIHYIKTEKEQVHLNNLASLGDVDAITTLLNRAVNYKNIIAKVSLKNNCLQLILESAQVPDEKVSIEIIRKELAILKVKSIKTIKTYGREIGEEFPAWSQEFDLATQGNLTAVPAVATKQRSENSQFIAALRTFKFASVVPYKDALSSELYSSHTVRLLLFFGLFPLVVSLIARTAGLQQIAWILGIYYASIWGVVLYDLLKPAQFSWADTLKCVLFTAFIGIPLVLFVQNVPPFSTLYTAIDQGGLIPRLIGFVLGVGILEESCKALPVYLFLLRPGKLKDPLTSAFYGAMSGLGFAIAEGVSYSSRYAISLVEGQSDFGSYVLSNTIRFVSLPLFHAIWAGIVGYFLGLAALNPSRQTPIIFIGVAICAVLHGLYDTFANGFVGLAIVAFSILLFVAYLRRSQQMVDEMQQAELGYRKSR